MPRGGARPGSGPKPNPHSLRTAIRTEKGTMPPVLSIDGVTETLPRARAGRAPAWPLSTATPTETKVWREHWKLPQAIIWERNEQHMMVAMYVRTFVQAMEHDAKPSLRSLVLRQQQNLLLDVMALRRAGFQISRRETTSGQPASTSSPTEHGSTHDFRDRLRPPSSRGRLQAVPKESDE